MNITIRGFSGNEVAILQVDRSENVHALKKAVYAAIGVAVTKQRLLAGAALLRDVDQLATALPDGDAADLTLVLTDKWAHEVAEDWRRLRKAPEAIRNDPEVVLQAIAHSQGQAVKFAGEKVRANGDVLLAAMRLDASLARYATGGLTRDAAFMLAAAEPLLAAGPEQRERAALWRWSWREFAELCASRAFMLSVVSTCGDALQHAAAPLRADREVVGAAVRQSGVALAHASPELREDGEIARLAVDGTALAFQHVGEQLRADRDFVMRALQRMRARGRGVGVLQHAPATLRADREVVSAAVRRFPPDLQYASDELRSDRTIVELAVERESSAIRHAAEALQRDPGFVLSLVQRDPAAFASLCPAMQADREVALEAVKRGGCLLEHASEELQADLEVVLAAVRQHAMAYSFVREPLRASREVAAAALQKNWCIFFVLPQKLHCDRGLLMLALRSRGMVKPGRAAGRPFEKMTTSTLLEKLRGPS